MMRARLKKKLSRLNIRWLERREKWSNDLSENGYNRSKMRQYEKFYTRIQKHRANSRWWRDFFAPMIRAQQAKDLHI